MLLDKICTVIAVKYRVYVFGPITDEVRGWYTGYLLHGRV